MRKAYFGPGLFDFLRDLAAHNDRAWFQAHQERYESEVRGPLLRFIGDFGPVLRGISARFLSDPRPVGGSMFRLHRDTRFSKDKSPYKRDALKRPPAGYDAAHPFVDDLKGKDFYTMTRFSENEVCAPDFMEEYLEACRMASPLVAFLTKAVGLRW